MTGLTRAARGGSTVRRRWLAAGAAAFAVVVVALIAGTALLTPQQIAPAFDAALRFMNAAGRGDEATAFALLDDAMQAYVRDNCPQGRVTACVDAYTPPEWGDFLSVVFRRAAPDPSSMVDGAARAFDVELIATYSEEVGFSGVCIYQRMEQDAGGAWRVAGYAGFVSCGDPASRNMASNPDAPNRAP